MIFTLFLFSLHLFYSFRHLWLVCQKKTCTVCFPLSIFTYQFSSHFYEKFFHCCKILLAFYFCHYIHFFAEISIDLSRETIFCSDLQFFVYFGQFLTGIPQKITRKQLKSRPWRICFAYTLFTFPACLILCRNKLYHSYNCILYFPYMFPHSALYLKYLFLYSEFLHS